MEQLVTVKQGMQPTFDGVRVGVVKIGIADGAPAIQFWIRTAEQERKQAFRAGQSVALPGAGLLTIASIQPADGTTPASATLAYDDGHVTE
ncbi:hypothetical protein [Arthrobacter sp. StoSoilB13]|uniref:hypothetical protein n=1 Tax=Arthrobacter sp. StoSoilB13 TaxID=2830993 RepID=UPI001CC3BBF7|nr:hypothetical protein [Arthrobacter sp. StoSoilB13]BCW50023.1 hypothetical protein StoSoilB13_23650 [Arthrobacter sp. StoSoilB13]